MGANRSGARISLATVTILLIGITVMGGSAGAGDPAAIVQSPCPSGSASPGSPEPSPCPSPSASSPSPTPTNTIRGRTPRSLELLSSRSTVTWGEKVTFFGFIESSPRCEAAQKVEIQRRIVSSGRRWHDFRSSRTNANGRFEERATIRRSSEYRATAPRTRLCRRDVSDSVQVKARVKVVTFVSDTTPQQDSNFRMHGRVKPRHGGTDVVLQRRVDGRWRRVSSQPLSARSTFSFFPFASWTGGRTFRVLWPRGDFDHLGGLGRAFRITTHP